MRKFLFKIIIFTLPLVLYFGMNSAINYGIYSNQKVDLGQLEVLILGDSHPQKSIDPELFSKAKNISQQAEPYVLSYWKLKKILESNQLESLVLGFSPHNIAEFNDYKFSKEKWCSEMFRRSYPIENYKSIDELVSVNYKSFYKTLWKETSFYPTTEHQNFIGKYSKNESSDISDWQKIIKRHYYWKNEQLGLSELSISYLDSIVKISNKHNIKLILAGSPIHEKYSNHIPEEVMKRFEDLKTKYQKQTIIFDRIQNHKYADSLFFNADHLNEIGAKKFTLDLNNFMKH
ncbi:MAG: hypothetical protein ABR595_07215 [Psychroflexus sp.]